MLANYNFGYKMIYNPLSSARTQSTIFVAMKGSISDIVHDKYATISSTAWMRSFSEDPHVLFQPPIVQSSITLSLVFCSKPKRFAKTMPSRLPVSSRKDPPFGQLFFGTFPRFGRQLGSSLRRYLFQNHLVEPLRHKQDCLHVMLGSLGFLWKNI